MKHAHFHLKRLRVVKGGKPAYDQSFHLGVNIIRGENGSGKSTISDFIFYVLGGEFDNWKTVASSCDEVQAEIATKNGVVTLRREIDRALTPIHVYFGSFEDAEKHGLDGWERFSIRRGENRESFSQILFRSAGIPEAQSQNASNITMHQILRLLYSDQRTPSALLFRYESFDTREIRDAVGDLVCGLSVYELYEAELQARELAKQFDEKNKRFSALLAALTPTDAITRTEVIDTRQTELSAEYARLSLEIDGVDAMVDQTEVATYVKARSDHALAVRKLRAKIAELEERRDTVELEMTDLQKFIAYLEELAVKVHQAQAASEIVGSIDFSHCPACLAPLTADHGAYHCVLCGAETDAERERSRYLQIKLDLDIQLRESRQLLDDKEHAIAAAGRDMRGVRRSYEEQLSEYAVRYDRSTSPRESYLAQRYQRLGQIDREKIELDRIRERTLEIERLSEEKAALQEQLNRVKDRLKGLETACQRRRTKALTRVSENAKEILKKDLDRQAEFKTAQNVSIQFGDNSILVDGELNFAESSNVVVKNSAILSLLLSACQDEEFYHPRFVLFDNIEDKGMEQDRSHNFQAVIAEMSASAAIAHQIIFTTSMLNPDLNKDEYVIGPHYTHVRRTLELVGRESISDEGDDSPPLQM